MHKMICVFATVSLAACAKEDVPSTNLTNMTTANEPAKTSVAAAFPINQTTWEFSRDGKPMQESVDPQGNYITTSGAKHIDHGTVVMKDGKACFTSAMTKKGEVCWTNPKVEVGASGETTSDKGEKLSLKRVAYIPKTM